VSFQTAHLSELEAIPVGDRGLVWRPIRSRFDIRAFGVNAYTAEPGGEVVEEHTEETYGHEEIYVVVSGRATFTLDGEEVDAPTGTIVHLPDPSVRRTAVAEEPGTTVLAVGGRRGEVFRPSPWELHFRAASLPPDEAVRLMEEGGAAYDTDVAGFQYNLACYRALAGDGDGALAAFRRAFELEPDRVRTWAAGDSDLDSIRAGVDAVLDA
jgi:quercetin dioxygenase-like cupin family protein